MQPDQPGVTGDARLPVNGRRDFLKRLAGTLTGSAMLTELPWLSPLAAAPVGQAASDRVRIGVIGVGSRGSFLTDHLRRTPGVQIAAVCDNYAPNLERAVATIGGGVRGHADYRALLDQRDIDGVVIATPLYLHAPMTLAALGAGKHVFCEKSLARTIEDCQRVASAARAAAGRGQVFQIGHQRMFDGRFHQALSHMRAGALGPITQIRAYWHRNLDWRRPAPTPALERQINWRLYRAYSAGLMGELGSHHLHVANWILDAPPLSVVGYGSTNYWKDGREVFDNVNLIYRYPGGVSVIYDSLSSNRHHGMEVQVMGPKGTMELETGRMFWETPPSAAVMADLAKQLRSGSAGTVPLAAPTWTPELKADAAGVPIMPNWAGDDGSGLSLAGFANAIRARKPAPEMIEHAYRSGVSALIGLEAMEQGREVAWPGNNA